MCEVHKRGQELVRRFIEDHPHFPGADRARVVHYGIPVYVVIGVLEEEGIRDVPWPSDKSIQITAKRCELPVLAVEAALLFYRENKDIIDARMTLGD